jgi:transposase InsO family protein
MWKRAIIKEPMGQILHSCARTTTAVRRAIQHSQESLLKLSERYSINPKTVQKWRRRSFVEDAPMGPKERRSTTLTPEQEAVVLAFRKHTLLPLDDCLYALQATLPHLTRSALHRCFQRHGVSRLPHLDAPSPTRKKFKTYPIGYFHIDLTEVRTEEGKLYLFVAVDRTSKFAFARLVEKATRRAAADFLQALIKALPYKIHTVLTDNGTHFTSPGNGRSAAPDIKLALAKGESFRAHAFEHACASHDIDHRLTKPNHPWTNGQVERMNRTIKEATVRTYHYQSQAQLQEHLAAFLNAYNFAKRLKTLAGLTSYQFICSCWQREPHRFISNPHRHSLGLNI